MAEAKQAQSKDQVVFFDKNSLTGPIAENFKLIERLAENDPDSPGLVLPNGTINWSCPCIGTAGIGPCSQFFRAAFKCFHYSEAPVKGSDCLREFEKLQECMKKYPSLYK